MCSCSGHPIDCVKCPHALSKLTCLRALIGLAASSSHGREFGAAPRSSMRVQYTSSCQDHHSPGVAHGSVNNYAQQLRVEQTTVAGGRVASFAVPIACFNMCTRSVDLLPEDAVNIRVVRVTFIQFPLILPAHLPLHPAFPAADLALYFLLPRATNCVGTGTNAAPDARTAFSLQNFC